MTITDLQNRLAKLGFFRSSVNGTYDLYTRSALMSCLKAGPDTVLSPTDVAKAAAAITATPADIRTVVSVEAAGAGFYAGLPKILFEGHIFSRLTKGRYDRTHSTISYPKWDKSKYPNTQDGRYEQLLDAVALDPDAAFASASYGAFQILGNNYKVCGFAAAFDFVLAQCRSEGDQLNAFIAFIKGNKLDDALRNHRWAEFARGYNGTAYKENQYDVKLAQAYVKQAQTTTPPQTLAGTYKITDKINLRASPGGTILGTIAAGGFVNVLRDLGAWVEVNYAPGKNGYVSSQFLAKA